MSQNKQTEQPTQKTPKGYEIPVPTEQEVEDALDKLAKPSKPLPQYASFRNATGMYFVTPWAHCTVWNGQSAPYYDGVLKARCYGKGD